MAKSRRVERGSMDGAANSQMPAQQQPNPAVVDLTTPQRNRYLTAIDRLREIGLSDSNVSLPQLVVVGDQSSGKSSLLESITGFGFPVASDLCTRFATQIVLKRGPEYYMISIIPGSTARLDESTKEAYKEFGKRFDANSFGAEQLQKVIADASFLMGLPSTLEESADASAKRFSDDVLKIEISGPDHHNLSVVDVPGLFHNPTIYQTEEDKTIIRAMINSHICDDRTIILAVMDARNNLANQEVFRMAREADVEGTRTVGVITKCDAVQEGDEDAVLRIAKNEVEHLKYGWFAVRNRSTKEIAAGVTIAQRHENEQKTFSSAPWNQLHSSHCGVPALKLFLGDLLFQHIKREFPGVVRDVERLHAETRRELDLMGPPRKTPAEQRQFLIKLATSYQRLAEDSLTGNYDATLPADHPLKLRMHLKNNDEEFARRIQVDGHYLAFRTVEDKVDDTYKRDLTRDGNIYDWIRAQYKSSRGSELPGMINISLMENLFRQQAEPWDNIAMEYVENAERIIRSFNAAAHDRLVAEPDMAIALLAEHGKVEREVGSSAHDELARFLVDERKSILHTVNHYFAQTLQKLREARVLARFKQAGLSEGFNDVDLAKLVQIANLSNEDQAVNDIHDILKSYYKVALKRFMDNVVKSVVERHLLGHEGTVKFFTAEYVSTLDDDDLAALAEESIASAGNREETCARTEMLEQALSIVRSV